MLEDERENFSSSIYGDCFADDIETPPSVPCPDCHGRGQILLLISTVPCASCKGTGQIAKTVDP